MEAAMVELPAAAVGACDWNNVWVGWCRSWWGGCDILCQRRAVDATRAVSVMWPTGETERKQPVSISQARNNMVRVAWPVQQLQL